MTPQLPAIVDMRRHGSPPGVRSCDAMSVQPFNSRRAARPEDRSGRRARAPPVVLSASLPHAGEGAQAGRYARVAQGTRDQVLWVEAESPRTAHPKVTSL